MLVNKSYDVTSFSVVNKIKKHFALKKVGHAGTLDLLATGLLVILIGKATKLSRYFIEDDKEYKGVIGFGIETDTYDREGNIINEKSSGNISKEKIEAALKEFEGEIEQVPPAFSAAKVNGKKAYELARKGKAVALDKRKVIIYRLKLKKLERGNFPKVHFYALVSKGTYIRTLAHDIGKKLSTFAYLHELKRTASGAFKLKNAHNLEEVAKLDEKALSELLLPIEKAIDFPKISIGDKIMQAQIKNGQAINNERLFKLNIDKLSLKRGQLVKVINSKGELLAIHKMVKEGTKTEVVF